MLTFARKTYLSLKACYRSSCTSTALKPVGRLVGQEQVGARWHNRARPAIPLDCKCAMHLSSWDEVESALTSSEYQKPPSGKWDSVWT